MEGRNDSPQSFVLSEYRSRNVACEHIHAFRVRCHSQYAGWHHAGAVTNSVSFTESDADAESDVASAPASLEATGLTRLRMAPTSHGLLAILVKQDCLARRSRSQAVRVLSSERSPKQVGEVRVLCERTLRRNGTAPQNRQSSSEVSLSTVAWAARLGSPCFLRGVPSVAL
jgi:hypothetical protein